MGPESKSRSDEGMPSAGDIRLALGEMNAAEMRVAVAAVRWMLSRAVRSERGTRWISAQDELPEDDQIVVACRKDRGSEIVYGEVFKRNLEHVGTWAMTHWFALPSLPSERKC